MAKIDPNDRRRRNDTAGRLGGANFYATAHDEANEQRARQTTSPTRYGGTGTGVGSADNQYGQVQTQRPQQPQQGGGGGGYTQDPNAAQANALYQQLMSRGPFRYDLQGDMLYRQYADQYSMLGQQAMRDTMGTAAGLTGGYGNSWAGTMGQQAYQQYLGQLNGMIPDFYDRAYQAWQDQGDQLLQQYQLALSRIPTGGGGGGAAAASGVAAAQDQQDYVNALAAYLQSVGGAIGSGMQGIAGQIPAQGAATEPVQINPAPDLDLADLWYKRFGATR